MMKRMIPGFSGKVVKEVYVASEGCGANYLSIVFRDKTTLAFAVQPSVTLTPRRFDWRGGKNQEPKVKRYKAIDL
jgi:hypothetical protein